MKDGEQVDLWVYGTEELCASCVNLPSSKETAVWLAAVLERRYGKQVQVHYVDFEEPQDEVQSKLATQIIEEELWYPVIVLADMVVSEGNPRLPLLYQKLESLGVKVK
ncbi:YuzD family protein [Mechercharimyces sp. CAU 1602]|uniref:YuzD family protein n=1 Tax=Mechercharimyces sp. CAU 1602 TaxID=2973933 RepID=UPI002162324A|nr:YuzD family protein [Mechercharimyces sp. CAU 1602]MCS1351769.1 YuzD family protein [Mechercharimyces sp. CAU 1602]